MSKFKIGNKVRVLKSKDDNIEEIKEMIGGIFEIDCFFDNAILVYNADKSESWLFQEDELELIEEPKNLIPLIAKELGVEIGEEFMLTGVLRDGISSNIKFRFTNNGIEINDYYWMERPIFLASILNGKYKIQKLTPKPKLTEAERVILENLPKECKYITRESENANNDLGIHRTKPKKLTVVWSDYSLEYYLDAFNHLFQFIKWEDNEPYKIQELLEEYENIRSE